MIKPLNLGKDIEKEFHLEKSDLDAVKQKIAPKTSSKMMVMVGFILLIFIFGIMGMKVLNARLLKPTSSKKSTSSQKPLSFFSINKDQVIEQAQKTSSGFGEQLLKAGREAGAAVLGATVQFMQKTASESAPMVASAAANLVIQSTVPALVDQIKKLPPNQQNEIKNMICK